MFTGFTPWENLKTPGKQISKEAFYGRIRFELYEGRRPRLPRDETGALMESPAGKFPQAELLVALITDCMEDRPQDRPGDFERIVERLESIKKQYLEARMKHNQAIQIKKVGLQIACVPCRNIRITLLIPIQSTCVHCSSSTLVITVTFSWIKTIHLLYLVIIPNPCLRASVDI